MQFEDLVRTYRLPLLEKRVNNDDGGRETTDVDDDDEDEEW